MTDIVEVVRSASSVQRNAWSDTPEGKATRQRAFSTEPKTVPRDRFRKWPDVVAAALVLALVGAVALLATDRGAEAPKLAGAPTLHQLTHGRWEVLPSRPIRGLHDATVLWTGRRLLVWSSADDRGAALDPTTGAWTQIRPSGILAGQPPVWAGDRMIVWAGATEGDASVPSQRGASYDPRSRRWTTITQAPIRPLCCGYPPATVWTGSELFVVEGHRPCSPDVDCETFPWAAAAYEPKSDTWRLVDALPFPPAPPTAGRAWVALAWDGERVGLLAIGGTAWALDAVRGTWAQLAATPYQLGLAIPVSTPDGLIWVGNQIQYAPGEKPEERVPWRVLRLAAHRSEWEVVAAPFDGRTISPIAAVGVGRYVAVLGGPAPSAVLDTISGTWHRMPAPKQIVGLQHAGAYWTGNQIVGLDASGRIAVYTPGPR